MRDAIDEGLARIRAQAPSMEDIELSEPMMAAEREFRTLEAVKAFLESAFPDHSVEKEYPRTTTAHLFIVSGRHSSYVVGLIDEFVATIVNSGGYLTKELVADLFRRGDVLAKMEAARGGTVLIATIAGDTI